LLFVGRLSPQKNVPRLIDAVALATRPVELTIVGDGSERRPLEASAARRGLRNVRFVGAAHGDELAAYYRRADAFILASDKEGMPLAVLEAMAAGLPVIATDVPGVRETVGDDGLVVTPSAPAVAAAIDRLASDRVLMARLANRSRARGSTAGWESRIDSLEALYEEVAAW
jgi:phosphatidylinositol alpha-mannosyltransferase